MEGSLAIAEMLFAVITGVEYCKSAFGHCSFAVFSGDRATSLWARKAPTTLSCDYDCDSDSDRTTAMATTTTTTTTKCSKKFLKLQQRRQQQQQ